MIRTSVHRVPRTLRRLASLLVAILLVATWSADAFGLHRCPHHDSLPGDAAQHAGHGAHHGAPAHDSHSACTCIGACAPGVALTAPGVNADVFAVAPDFVRAVPAPTVPILPDHALALIPFAQAPPLA
ncbi:MAG TPA: hypothetical protein VFQ38_06620 [Longimicrobiales bacterium]|nr:hypothetical protein [Longimicrobiales bacterium]